MNYKLNVLMPEQSNPYDELSKLFYISKNVRNKVIRQKH